MNRARIKLVKKKKFPYKNKSMAARDIDQCAVALHGPPAAVVYHLRVFPSARMGDSGLPHPVLGIHVQPPLAKYRTAFAEASTCALYSKECRSFLVSQASRTKMFSHRSTSISYLSGFVRHLQTVDRQLARITSYLLTRRSTSPNITQIHGPTTYKSPSLRWSSRIPDHPRNADQRRRPLHSQ